MSSSLLPHGLLPARFLQPWDSPGKNTRAGCHFLLQGIFQTQGSNLHLLHLLLLLLSHFNRVQLCHRRQPTRLSHPWDSPGKTIGVGCHFLLQRQILHHCTTWEGQERVSGETQEDVNPGAIQSTFTTMMPHHPVSVRRRNSESPIWIQIPVTPPSGWNIQQHT